MLCRVGSTGSVPPAHTERNLEHRLKRSFVRMRVSEVVQMFFSERNQYFETLQTHTKRCRSQRKLELSKYAKKAHFKKEKITAFSVSYKTGPVTNILNNYYLPEVTPLSSHFWCLQERVCIHTMSVIRTIIFIYDNE